MNMTRNTARGGCWRRGVVALGMAALGVAATPLAAADAHAPARFRVTDTVVTPGLEPFTATASGMGNCIWNCAFEPAEFRTCLISASDAPDRVVASVSELTHYDSLREGFYDGATVRVYRVVNGKVTLVRRDVVPEGGSHLSGWTAVTPDGALLAPNVGHCAFRFEAWNRPAAPYWFTLRAVDREGRESPCAPAVSIVKPTRMADGKSDFVTTAFNGPKTPAASGAPPAAPAHFTGALAPENNGNVNFTWQPADAGANVAGYRLYISDTAPADHKGYALTLAGQPAASNAWVRAGDWVVLSKTFDTFSRNKLLANRVWGASQHNRIGMPQGAPFYPDENPAHSWTLERYPVGKPCPVADGGLAAIKFTLKDAEPVRFEQYNHAGTFQSWYPVLKTNTAYVVEVWLKQEGMQDPSFTFQLSSFYGKQIQPLVFRADGQWRLYRATFTPRELWEREGSVGQMILSFHGPGTVWMDNLRVYAEESPFLALSPVELDSLKASGMSAVRTHAFIKTGMSTYNLDLFTNPGGAANGTAKENTLPQTLAIMQKAGVVPWLQVEMHFAPEEWRGLIEYLAAPYDPRVDTPARKPWAFKRFSQGRERPWTEAFERIYFEISNETWNGLFRPWVFSDLRDAATGKTYSRGEVYGLFQEYVRETMASSPWWRTADLDRKMRFVIGGWAINDYGTRAASCSPHSRYLTIAAYNGGWDEGEGATMGDDASLARVLLNPPQSAAPRAAQLRADRDRLRATVNPTLDLGTYEAGPGYALSGLNGQAQMSRAEVLAQERTMKSLAGGTATLDTFMTFARQGFTLQNFFTFTHGHTHWVSHTDWYKGSRAHPCWMALALFNREATGDMLDVATETVPTTDLPAFKRRKALRDVPLVAAYATRHGDRLNLLLLSRKLDHYPEAADDGFTPVTVALPFARASRVTCHRMTGNPRATNLDAEDVRIEKVALPAQAAAPLFTLSAQTGADDRGLPPGATFLYVFEGVK